MLCIVIVGSTEFMLYCFHGYHHFYYLLFNSHVLTCQWEPKVVRQYTIFGIEPHLNFVMFIFLTEENPRKAENFQVPRNRSISL